MHKDEEEKRVLEEKTREKSIFDDATYRVHERPRTRKQRKGDAHAWDKVPSIKTT